MWFGATWCSLVQLGADWFNLVHFGATWCSLVQLGAIWCNLVQLGGGVSFLLRCYAITARFFTLLSYWHQSYCKKQVFHSYYVVTLLRQGSSVFFLLSIKATVKSKYFILITLLPYYGKALYYTSFLLASKVLSESN